MPTLPEDLRSLKALGRVTKPTRTLESFPCHAPGMDIALHCTEFTCVCPLTGQPDFATIDIVYTPGKYIVESKSMKLYLETYRNVGIFHEHLAVDIGKDFVKFIKPKKVSVTVRFNVRGGIAIDATWTSGHESMS